MAPITNWNTAIKYLSHIWNSLTCERYVVHGSRSHPVINVRAPYSYNIRIVLTAMKPDGFRLASNPLSAKYASLINHNHPQEPCNASYIHVAAVQLEYIIIPRSTNANEPNFQKLITCLNCSGISSPISQISQSNYFTYVLTQLQQDSLVLTTDGCSVLLASCSSNIVSSDSSIGKESILNLRGTLQFLGLFIVRSEFSTL